MFREKLKADLDKLSPSENTKSLILENLNKKSKAKISTFRVTTIIAACLAVVILLGTFCDRFISDYFIVEDALPPGVYTASKKQDMIYNAVIEGKSSGTLSAKGYYDDFYSAYGYNVMYDVSSSINEGYVSYYTDTDSKEKHTYKAGITQSKGNKTSKNDEDYSDTNKQVQNVDEDDIVKTDGKYIYKLSETYGVRIYKADGENTKIISSVRMYAFDEEDVESLRVNSFYLCDGKLVVLSEVQKYLNENECECRSCKIADLRYFTRVSIYNIENIEEPELEKTFEQSGIYDNSRIIGDVLYLNSIYETHDAFLVNPDIIPEKNDKKLYMPLLCEDKKTKLQDVDSIEIGKDLDVTDYSVLCSYDISDVSRVDDISFFGASKIGYVSEDNIYFTESIWYDNDESVNKTAITRLQANNGKIEKQATGMIDGQILNQFSMDENMGYLRLVAETDNDNALYILDMNLKHISSIRKIAKGEQLESARFIGDYVYFVTFKQVDPLFCADLSNPKRPKIVSKLKIPGFSEYLHPFGEDKLLGFGQNGDEDGQLYSLKLSMFDIAEPTKITEKNKEFIKSDYSEVSDNHKAILVSHEKNIIAFSSIKVGYSRNELYYHIYSYDEKNGFTEKLKLTIDSDYLYSDYSDENSDCSDEKLRGLYIGNYFYIVGNGDVIVVDLNTFKVVK